MQRSDRMTLPATAGTRRRARPPARRPARRLVGAEGFSDERMDELGSAFVTHHVGEGGGQLAMTLEPSAKSTTP
jgi:hypothetical protein